MIPPRMLLTLIACTLLPDSGVEPTMAPTPDPPSPERPAPIELTPAPHTPAPSGAPKTDVPPQDTDAPPPPPKRVWHPKVPYASKITAPDWPDPGIDPDRCEELESGGPVRKDGCVTDELKCGDRIIGHTRGGIEKYNSRFYESKFCWPNMIDHDGGDERVYKLTMPGGEWRAWVTMYTPCADLSMAAVRHQGRTCPTEAHPIRVCEMSPKEGLTTERLELTTQTPAGADPTWYIIVEGADEEEGLFELVVQCHPGVGGSIPKN